MLAVKDWPGTTNSARHSSTSSCSKHVRPDAAVPHVGQDIYHKYTNKYKAASARQKLTPHCSNPCRDLRKVPALEIIPHNLSRAGGSVHRPGTLSVVLHALAGHHLRPSCPENRPSGAHTVLVNHGSHTVPSCHLHAERSSIDGNQAYMMQSAAPNVLETSLE